MSRSGNGDEWIEIIWPEGMVCMFPHIIQFYVSFQKSQFPSAFFLSSVVSFTTNDPVSTTTSALHIVSPGRGGLFKFYGDTPVYNYREAGAHAVFFFQLKHEDPCPFLTAGRISHLSYLATVTKI